MRLSHPSPLLLPVLLLLVAAPFALAQETQPDGPGPELLTREFLIQHKSIEDAVAVVTEISLRQGTRHNSVNIWKAQKKIVVTDIREVVEAIATALNSFDVPPRQVRITLKLMQGDRGEPSAEPDPEAVYRSVVAELRKALQYTSYTPLGNLSVVASEGEDPTSVTLGTGYTIEFVVSSVDTNRNLVQLKPLVLTRKGVEGKPDTEIFDDMTLTLKAGQELVLVASSEPSAHRGLLLAIAAYIVD